MPILNMIVQGSGGGGGSNVGEPTNLSAMAISNSEIEIKWTDNNLQALPPSTFQKSVLVRKVGSAPTTPSDGTTVVTETVMNTYQSSAYTDTGLTEGTTYYYQVFSYSTDGGITYGTSVSATPSGGWQPGVNTLAYYPLEIDTKDYSGNGRDGTNNGVTFSNNLGVFNGGSYVSLGTGSWTNIQTNMTINVWFNRNGSGIKDNCVVAKGQYYMPDYDGAYYAITVHEEDMYLCGGFYSGSDYNIHPMNFRSIGGGSPTTGPVTQANKWYNVVITSDGTTKKAYVDGVLYATENISSTTSTVSIDTRIGSMVRDSYDSFFNGNISKVIFEDKTRTAQEVSNYYNQTKGDYGIS